MFGGNITIFILATESIGQMKWRQILKSLLLLIAQLIYAIKYVSIAKDISKYM